MIECSTLSNSRLELCGRIMSANTFFFIVMHHVLAGQGLSVTRMGDAEGLFLMHENLLESDTPMVTFPGLGSGETNEQWLKRMGFFGITPRELRKRMDEAVGADYFGPSISGMFNPKYDLFETYNHPRLVDNFFVNNWTQEMKRQLYSKADGIIVIHAKAEIADEFQRRLSRFSVKFVKLERWQETEDVVAKAQQTDGQLVLFSGGTASKFLATRLGRAGKVAIDVGNSMPGWIPDK